MTVKLNGIKAIFFDLDETLINAPAGLKAAHKAVVRKLIDYFPSELSNRSTKSLCERLRKLDDRMNIQTHYNRDEWWSKFLEELGIDRKLGSSQIRELTQTYWNTYIQAAKPYDETEPVLEYLKGKGLALGVITDTDEYKTPKKRRISELEFSGLLDVIVVSGEDTEQTKPDPEPFELAAQQLNMEPSECAMVGDKPFTDISGARSAGMKTILLKRRDWGEKGEPDLILYSLGELLKIF